MDNPDTWSRGEIQLGVCPDGPWVQWRDYDNLRQQLAEAQAERDRAVKDSKRLDYIERKFSGMTNRERYLPVQMVWGKGCNGRTLREACDKYMTRRDAAIGATAAEGP